MYFITPVIVDLTRIRERKGANTSVLAQSP